MAEASRDVGNLLLDTHVVIWWRTDDARLADRARRAIAEAPAVFVSAASAWEVAIKQGLGRLRLPESFSHGVEDSGFHMLPVHFAHAELAGTLPRHHRDPFDRMLVAQAKIERLTLVTHDEALRPYPMDALIF